MSERELTFTAHEGKLIKVDISFIQPIADYSTGHITYAEKVWVEPPFLRISHRGIETDTYFNMDNISSFKVQEVEQHHTTIAGDSE